MKRIPVKVKNTPKVRAYERAMEKGAQIRHVYKNDVGWAVKRSGAKKASVIVPRQVESVHE